VLDERRKFEEVHFVAFLYDFLDRGFPSGDDLGFFLLLHSVAEIDSEPVESGIDGS
jgi:hypothetical protein